MAEPLNTWGSQKIVSHVCLKEKNQAKTNPKTPKINLNNG